MHVWAGLELRASPAAGSQINEWQGEAANPIERELKEPAETKRCGSDLRKTRSSVPHNQPETEGKRAAERLPRFGRVQRLAALWNAAAFMPTFADRQQRRSRSLVGLPAAPSKCRARFALCRIFMLLVLLLALLLLLRRRRPCPRRYGGSGRIPDGADGHEAEVRRRRVGRAAARLRLTRIGRR